MLYCIAHSEPLQLNLKRILLLNGSIWVCWFTLVPCIPAIGHESNLPTRTAATVRIRETPPRIDGIIDDPVWQIVPVTSEFRQREPDVGKAATEKTTVQIVYDNKAIYIAIRCHDENSGEIVARRTRRDYWVDMDWVAVHIDPLHDHETGYVFQVGASGSMLDGILFDDSLRDVTWDGVWDAKVSIDEYGWSTEIHIPFHVVRFVSESSRSDNYWGINFERHVLRRQERSHWNLVPQGQSGWVSRFGHLEGLENVGDPTHLEVSPLLVTRIAVSKFDNRDPMIQAGLNARYNITPNLTLDVVLNPDFAQVEADPAELNLTVFETFLEERRPFFVKGKTLFKSPEPQIHGIGKPSQLFYSRRIGRPPNRFPIPLESEEWSRPSATTILGAGRFFGKTRQGTSFAFIDALTAKEKVDITAVPSAGTEHIVARRNFLIEPLTNYFVGRVKHDFRRKSSIGFTLTTVNYSGSNGSYVGSFDSSTKWKENVYRLYTRLSGSSTDPADERSNGYEAIAYFSKLSGFLGGQIYLDARSPGFNANDLGFMKRSNRTQLGAHVFAKKLKPWKLGRRSALNVNVWEHRSFRGLRLARGANVNVWNRSHRYWLFRIGLSRWFSSESDLETRGGPVMKQPATVAYWLNFNTDDRKHISLLFSLSGSVRDGSLDHSRVIRSRATGRIGLNSQIQLSVESSYKVYRNGAQWVANMERATSTHYVFGALESKIIDLTIRGQIAFRTNLTLQTYLQGFSTTGKYSNFKELSRPYSYEFLPFLYSGENPDFRRRSVRSHIVLRWEFKPGSSVYLVWSQLREAMKEGTSQFTFRPLSELLRSFADEGRNIFYMKCNFWMDLK